MNTMNTIARRAAPFAIAAVLAAPLVAAAQTGININAITPYSTGIINVINYILVPVLIAIAFIVFLWGIYKYFILGAANESEKAEGRWFALWGVVGFVIILSLWGLVNLVMSTFGLSVGTPPAFPTIGNATGVTTSGTQTGAGTNTTGGSTGSIVGRNVYNQNGSVLGSINSSGQIVNSNGVVVGRMINGQPYTRSGTPITGATVGDSLYGATGNTCAEGYHEDYDTGGCEPDTTYGATGSTCADGYHEDYDTGGCEPDTAQTSCTYPEVLDSDGQCTYMVSYPCPDGSNAADAASCPYTGETTDTTTYCSDSVTNEEVPCN